MKQNKFFYEEEDFRPKKKSIKDTKSRRLSFNELDDDDNYIQPLNFNIKNGNKKFKTNL